MCFCVHIKIQLFKIVSLTVVYKKIFVLRSTKDTSKLKFGKFRKGVDIPYIFLFITISVDSRNQVKYTMKYEAPEFGRKSTIRAPLLGLLRKEHASLFIFSSVFEHGQEG